MTFSPLRRYFFASNASRCRLLFLPLAAGPRRRFPATFEVPDALLCAGRDGCSAAVHGRRDHRLRSHRVRVCWCLVFSLRYIDRGWGIGVSLVLAATFLKMTGGGCCSNRGRSSATFVQVPNIVNPCCVLRVVAFEYYTQ